MEFVANHKATEIIKPGKEAFYSPAAAITTKRPSILRWGLSSVCSMWCYKLYRIVFPELFVKCIAVISLVANQAKRSFVNPESLNRGLNKRYFMRRSTGDANGERKTSAVCNCHDLTTLPTLCVPDFKPPFLAPAKVPSIKHSVISIFPRSLRSIARAIRMVLNTPAFTQNWNRRWHVWYGGYLLGISFHGAPVRNTHKIPLRISRSLLKGLPFPSGFFFGAGNNGSINAHCSFVSSM